MTDFSCAIDMWPVRFSCVQVGSGGCVRIGTKTGQSAWLSWGVAVRREHATLTWKRTADTDAQHCTQVNVNCSNSNIAHVDTEPDALPMHGAIPRKATLVLLKNTKPTHSHVPKAQQQYVHEICDKKIEDLSVDHHCPKWQWSNCIMIELYTHILYIWFEIIDAINACYIHIFYGSEHSFAFHFMHIFSSHWKFSHVIGTKLYERWNVVVCLSLIFGHDALALVIVIVIVIATKKMKLCIDA